MAKSSKSTTIANRLREIAVQKTALDQEEAKLKHELAVSTRSFMQDVIAFLDPTAD